MKELPGEAYTSEHFARLERATVFHRNWVHAAGSHEVAEPGDVLPVSVAGMPIVLVRQRDGSLRGFHNVCRHRGCLLVTAPQQQRPLMTCKFHAWGYGLDGHLARTPYWSKEDGTADPGFDPHAFGLLAVATAEWCGQVFVRLSAEGPSFEEHIAPMEARWKPYDLSLLRYGLQATYEVAANWKLVIQNYLDTYHLPFLHPQLGSVEQAKNYDDVNEADTLIGIFYRAGAADKDKGVGAMPVIPGLSPKLMAGQDVVLLYPNTLVELVPSHMMTIRIIPAGPELTREVMTFHFVGDAATAPEYAAAREALAKSWDKLNEQDFGVVTAWQAAQHSPAAADQPEVSPLWEKSGAAFRARLVREVAAASAVVREAAE